jgi:hypothetical protein
MFVIAILICETGAEFSVSGGLLMQNLYKPKSYPEPLRTEIKSMSQTAIEIANRWLLGWPKAVQALILSEEYLEALKGQEAQEIKVKLDTSMNHLSSWEKTEVMGLSQCPPAASKEGAGTEHEIETEGLARYVFRFFFDGCAGDCLWSSNDAAREKYGYPASLDDLGLSEETIAKANELMQRACLMAQKEPDVYGVSYYFSTEEEAEYLCEVAELLSTIRNELGADFEIVDEF